MENKAEISHMLRALVNDYIEDMTTFLEDNPQEAGQDFLLLEDARKLAKEKSVNFEKSLLGIPVRRLKALYLALLEEKL
jgi:hypothetical protein